MCLTAGRVSDRVLTNINATVQYTLSWVARVRSGRLDRKARSLEAQALLVELRAREIG